MDSRDLQERKEELQEQVLESFLETFEHYAEQTETFEDIQWDEEELDSWKLDWQDEINETTCIDDLEDEVSSSEWDFGIYFIPEDEFEDYCKEFLEECGDIPRELPFCIENNIDWGGVADDLRIDYSEVEFQGTTYLFRE